MKRPGLLVLGTVLLALAGLGWFFGRSFHWVKETRWQGYQGEAATNDFLAAQRLVQRLGHGAVCLQALPDPRNLPPSGDTLVLPARRVAIPRAQAEALARWVERGGTLLAEGLEPELPAARETQDPLFGAFGARLVALEDPIPDPQANLAVCAPEGAPLKVFASARLRLLDPGGSAVDVCASPRGIQALGYRRGLGRCHLVTSLGLLRNGALGDLDHAEFFWALARPGEAGGRVWIVTREQAPSPWRWLWRNGAPILVALAALIAGLLGAALPRFGPLLAPPEPGRRRFMEHLEASGRYHWRRNEGRPLLLACRASFNRRLARLHPGWTRLAPDDLCLRLARHAGLPEDQVFAALRYDTAVDPAGFLQAVQTLELLRKNL